MEQDNLEAEWEKKPRTADWDAPPEVRLLC